MKDCFFCVLFCWLAQTASVGLAAIESTPFSGTPFSVPGRFEAEEFDLGGEGVASHGLGPMLTTSTSGGVTVVTLHVPQERADANLGVADAEFYFSRHRFLALRPTEWVVYTVQNESPGYYSILLKAQGPVPLPVQRPCLAGGTEEQGIAPTLRIALDDVDLGIQTVNSDSVALQRVWLSVGLHRLKLQAESVQELFPAACNSAYNICLFDRWRLSTLPVDWIELVPAAPPLLRSDLAGRAKGFADGKGTSASWNNGRLIGETPSGDLLALDSKAIRLITRDGNIRTLAGHPNNPQQNGTGTKAGFGIVLDTAVTPGGNIFVLQAGNETNCIVSRLDLAGVVTSLFEGGGPRYSSSSDGLCFNARLRQLEPCRSVAFSHLILRPDGDLDAWGEYDASFLCGGSVLIPGWNPAGFHLSVATGMVTPLPVAPPVFDPNPVGSGFRLTNSVLHQEVAPGFFQPVFPVLHSAYRAKDGTLWGSDPSGVYQLKPDARASFLRIIDSPHGYVGGAPYWLVTPEEKVTLTARGATPFWKFDHWSDGDTNNPRALHLQRDTTLEAHFEFRLPEGNGINPKTVRVTTDGFLTFEILGADRGDAPYVYQMESSDDLKTWQPLSTATVLNVSGGFANGYLTAANPSTVVRVPASVARRYYRATLLAN